MTDKLCARARAWALGRRPRASQFVFLSRQEAGPDTGPQPSASCRVPTGNPSLAVHSQILPLISCTFLKLSATFFSIVQQNSHYT